MEKIDNLDRQILEIISQNARIPFKDVAAECGVSRAAIHQRVQRLCTPFLFLFRKILSYFLSFSIPTSSTSKIRVENGLICPDSLEP